MWILLFTGFSVTLAVAGLYAHRSARRFSVVDLAQWETIVARLQPVPFAGLERVALDHLQPRGNQLQLETDEMWELVGGWDGLRRMRRNADLIIQLAAYVRQWNHAEAVIVAERIRQDSLLLKRALLRIGLHRISVYKLRAPFYVHQAASSYYLMTRRLLALYETNQYLLYPRLAEAL
jgi:hypothetical protein